MPDCQLVQQDRGEEELKQKAATARKAKEQLVLLALYTASAL